MQFGIQLPNIGRFDQPDVILRLAQHAEALGFDSVWVGDHVAIPTEINSQYLYSRDGSPPFAPSANVFDALITLAVVAGCTGRVRLGTSVYVLPYRHPLLTAKQVASLDVLAGGRVVLGVGVGWLREEFAALGAPPYAARGRVTDEWLGVLRACWREPVVAHRGRYGGFEAVHVAPRPARPVPLWVGGNSAAALRRAGRLGDGWHGFRLTLDQLEAAVARVRQAAEEAGRDPNEVELTSGCTLQILDTPAERFPHRDLVGTPEQIAWLVQRMEEQGITHLVLRLLAVSSLEERLETMERFARDVRPLL